MVSIMGNRLSLDNITNMLLTLQKLKYLHEQKARSENKNPDYVEPDKLSLMQELLSIFTSILPQMRGPSYSTAFSCCNRYSNTYRELKRQIRGMSRSNFDSNNILEILKLVTPILESRQRLFMDKAVKIIDILQT